MAANHFSAQRYEWLDYTRFGAAMAVVLFHYTYNGINNGKLRGLPPFDGLNRFTVYGLLGVNLFFMISGFVIMTSAQSGSPIKFFVSRVFRLWPAFLFCLTITALVLWFFPSKKMPINWMMYTTNWTMIPNAFGVRYVDGAYWTLPLELTFYALVFILIALRAIHSFRVVIDLWLVNLCLYWFFGLGRPLVDGYDPYFLAGALFFFAYRDGYDLRTIVGLCLCLGGAIYKAYLRFGAWDDPERLIVLPVLVLGFFALFLTMGFRTIRLPAAQKVGAMTFPLYLLHAHIGYTLMSRFGSSDHPYLTVSTTIIAMIGSAYAVSQYIERPVQKYRATAEFWITTITKRIGRAITLPLARRPARQPAPPI